MLSSLSLSRLSAFGVASKAAWGQRALFALAIACAALPLIERQGLLQLAALLGVACSTLLVPRLWGAAAGGASRAQTGDDGGRSGPGTQEITALLATVLPVWSQHVSSVKDQTEEAVTKLAISFSSINKQFEAAGFGAAGGSGSADAQTAFSLLTLCERELRPVVSAMTRLMDSKKSLIGSVTDLVSATDELADMAHDVSLIAAHTNILAINAAIQAAHAQESGRGFAIIAQEIRLLSENSAAAGKRIGERMAQVKSIMRAAVEAAQAASAHDAEAIELSGSVIQDVLTHVRELGENADAMREKGTLIRADAENMLVNLQFQDRVGQIISVVDSDILRLHRSVANPDAPLPSGEEWLAELATHYTMDDQRHGQAEEASAEASNSSDDVVFF